MGEIVTPTGDAQENSASEGDVVMKETVTEVAPASTGLELKTETKDGVKLEELFGDVDSDDEFTSSGSGQLTPTSSSDDEAPPPGYILLCAHPHIR